MKKSGWAHGSEPAVNNQGKENLRYSFFVFMAADQMIGLLG